MKGKTRRVYTEEFKREAVRLMTEQGYSVAQVSENLGIDRSLIGRWRREHTSPVGSAAAGAAGVSGRLSSEERAELTRLRTCRATGTCAWRARIGPGRPIPEPENDPIHRPSAPS